MLDYVGLLTRGILRLQDKRNTNLTAVKVESQPLIMADTVHRVEFSNDQFKIVMNVLQLGAENYSIVSKEGSCLTIVGNSARFSDAEGKPFWVFDCYDLFRSLKLLVQPLF